MAPQAIITARLFQTIAMLIPIAVSASVRSSSSIGTAKTLIAKAKAANSAPTALPTKSSAHPVGVKSSIGTTSSVPGNGFRPKNSA